MNTRTVCVGLTLFSGILLAVFLRHTPQTLYSDPAMQLKALQQYLNGESDSFNRVRTPDPADLTRDTGEWFSWWPPGAQLIAYPLAARGISVGKTIRVMTIGLIVLGCVGWVFWFYLFKLPVWMQLSWAAFLPWMRYASNSLFAFSAEAIAFALTPWILCGSCALVERNRRFPDESCANVLLAFFLGLGLGSCYVLKYSMVFSSLAAIAYLLTCLPRKSWPSLIFGFLIPVAILNVINYGANRDMNPVVATAGFHWKILSLPWVVSLSALALTDAYSLLNYVFLHPVSGLYKHENLLCLLGLPGGALLMWFLFRRRAADGPARLALITLGTSMTAMLVVWNLTNIGNYDGRYLEVFSLSVLPVALEEAWVVWRQKAKLRPLLVSGGIFYVLVPLLYGVTSVVMKAQRLPSSYGYGPSHLYNGFLADHDAASVRAELLQDYRPATDIWYLPDPMTALDIPGRQIICFADFYQRTELEKMSYRSSASRRIRMLLPPRFEENGKGPVIRHSFPQAGPWLRKAIPGCNMLLWEAELKPR